MGTWHGSAVGVSVPLSHRSVSAGPSGVSPPLPFSRERIPSPQRLWRGRRASQRSRLSWGPTDGRPGAGAVGGGGIALG